MNDPVRKNDEGLNEDPQQTPAAQPAPSEEESALENAACVGGQPVFETWLTRYRKRLNAVDKESH